tara:strand:- start:257 stop:832 length:576 start_codon:yes stop_codon:yes gene_type:complete
MALTLNGSNNTIAGLAVGGLPDGIVDTDMLAAGAVTAPKRGTGAILQVVFADTNTEVNHNSTNWEDIGLSAAITPTATSSKILCLAQVQARLFIGHSNTDNAFALQLLRGSTAIQTTAGSYQVGYNHIQVFNTTSETSYMVPVNHLDSPSTTSATTYKIQGKNRDSEGVNAVHFQDDGKYYSTLTLLEVAG